jgi:radical SAM superfamily enzyme YgiQ (UPF0313 family)
MDNLLILNVPRLEPHRPPPGPAIIAQCCEDAGYNVTCIDLNIKFFHHCKKIGVDYYSFDPFWNHHAPIDDDSLRIVLDFIHGWMPKIVDLPYTAILLSVFGYSNTLFTELLLTEIRKTTRTRIIAGGAGIGTHTLLDETMCYGQKLKNEGLIDDFVVGEGELAVIKCLSNQQYVGVNNTTIYQINDLDSLPWPAYKYYNMDDYDYLFAEEKEIYITGSRGCVRKCTYCDVEKYWPKFRYRSGENIAKEIIMNYEELGVTRFYFTDSLVNGSLRAFNDMCDKLANYRFSTPISWSGQFIFRPKHLVPSDHFKTMKEAGANILYVGIETGSDRVRFDMGKKFTNDDIDYQLEECSKNRISVLPLLFTGYITETLDDHMDNLEMFTRWQKYVADGTIIGVELGSQLMILPGSPVERMIDSHHIEFLVDTDGVPVDNLWWSKDNPDLTVYERIRRKLEVHETAIKYAWPVWRQKSRLEDLKALILANNLHIGGDKQFYRIEKTGDVKDIHKSSVYRR